MKHMLLAYSTLFLVPLLSGCCSCGSYVDPCGSSPCGANYSGCVQASRPVSYGTSNGGCSSCQGGDETFSLPPVTSGAQPYTSMPAYGQPIYGQETYGPEVVGPEFVPGDSQWSPQVTPATPGSMSVTPAAPYNTTGGSNALTPPMPIPAVSPSSNVIPSPSPYSPTSQSGAGPMMPPVPPPPAEPISQMRFRTYR